MAHIAFQKYGIRPMDFLEMDPAERSFIIASMEIRAEEEDRAAKKIKSQTTRRKGR